MSELNFKPTVGQLATEPAVDERPPIDWMAVVKSTAFHYGVVLAIGLALCFFPLFPQLYRIWTGEDGYYTHGFLVPFISGYVIYRWWPAISHIPVKPGYVAAPLFLAALAVSAVGYISQFWSIMSFSLIALLLFGIWFVAGIRWMIAVLAPVLYLIFALPVWGSMIDVYTNPLQLLSTKVAYLMLKAMGFQPWKGDTTTIYLNHFTLDVGVPCSGLKLVLAITAFTCFFIMIGKLGWKSNALLVALILPLCLFMNGLRIAMIGAVGDTWGNDAGHKFHDYSGYLMLIICFFTYAKIARLLGWKD